MRGERNQRKIKGEEESAHELSCSVVSKGRRCSGADGERTQRTFGYEMSVGSAFQPDPSKALVTFVDLLLELGNVLLHSAKQRRERRKRKSRQ
jgi:hypothetical protein